MSERGGERAAKGPRLEDYVSEEESRRVEYDGAVAMRFGKHTLRYRPAHPGIKLVVAGPRLAFVEPEGIRADVEISCDSGPVTRSVGAATFDAPGGWEARQLPDGSTEICFIGHLDSTEQWAPWARLHHDSGLTRAEFTLGPREDGGRIEVGFPTDVYFVARHLARSAGVLLHASAVVLDGAAYLFVGHSGAGKSTTAMHALTVGAEVLSDDRTIVTMEPDGSVRAWGTPWHGSLRRATNLDAPVRGLFVIVQSKEDVVVPIGATRALGETFVRLVHPSPDMSEVALTFDTLERIVTSVPVAELRQRPTADGFRRAVDHATRLADGRGRRLA
jgi:hypothetical protein